MESGNKANLKASVTYLISVHSPARPTISNLEFDPSIKTLTCTSTGSPATVVTWMKDEQPLTIDGSTYQLTQTVTNRRESTYENVLTINDELNNIISHIFHCNIMNALGSASEEVRTLGENTLQLFCYNILAINYSNILHFRFALCYQD